MGQKDIAEKTLEEYNDVFADIVNGFVFKGKRVVKEDDLTDESNLSTFRKSKKIHQQERDVSKIWKKNNIRIALWGIENQTKPDPYMPLRVIAYDGASYKRQLVDIRKSEKSKNKIKIQPYPVITFVLCLDDNSWNTNKSLLETVKVVPELKPFVNDYSLNLIEVIGLSDSEVKRFKSDFRSLIEFIKKRKDIKYKVTSRKLDHPYEFAQLIYALTNDERSLEIVDELIDENEERGGVDMCDFYDKLENIGFEKGLEKGKVSALAELVKDGILTLKQAAERMGMSVAKFKAATKELAIN
ncbi:MAG: Rpn family recombination-promoting nuclease/putative transposase [Candidatus Riflebacteria bacterium]|nr:Rpn family recombination-promoting nuclease/putative transposase [Candidatus Riflebacteria bacterium]